MLVINNINLTEVRNKQPQAVDDDELVNLLFLHLTEEGFQSYEDFRRRSVDIQIFEKDSVIQMTEKGLLGESNLTLLADVRSHTVINFTHLLFPNKRFKLLISPITE